MPPTSIPLSWPPNSLIAKFFSQGGVKSIYSWPTATTGEASGLTRPATSWPAPTATAPASNPASAPRPAPGQPS